LEAKMGPRFAKRPTEGWTALICTIRWAIGRYCPIVAASQARNGPSRTITVDRKMPSTTIHAYQLAFIGRISHIISSALSLSAMRNAVIDYTVVMHLRRMAAEGTWSFDALHTNWKFMRRRN
jgi:hypothetical protein